MKIFVYTYVFVCVCVCVCVLCVCIYTRSSKGVPMRALNIENNFLIAHIYVHILNKVIWSIFFPLLSFFFSKACVQQYEIETDLSP